MNVVLEVLFLVAVTAVPTAIITLVLTSPSQPNVTREKPKAKKLHTKDLLEPIGGYWILELQDLYTGTRIHKIFRKNLVLGRTIDDYEKTGVLFIGNDQTISRRQCELTVTDMGVVVSNLSNANRTIHNGTELYRPEFVRNGDQIDVGNHSYRVTNITRTNMYN